MQWCLLSVWSMTISLIDCNFCSTQICLQTIRVTAALLFLRQSHGCWLFLLFRFHYVFASRWVARKSLLSDVYTCSQLLDRELGYWFSSKTFDISTSIVYITEYWSPAKPPLTKTLVIFPHNAEAPVDEIRAAWCKHRKAYDRSDLCASWKSVAILNSCSQIASCMLMIKSDLSLVYVNYIRMCVVGICLYVICRLCMNVCLFFLPPLLSRLHSGLITVVIALCPVA